MTLAQLIKKHPDYAKKEVIIKRKHWSDGLICHMKYGDFYQSDNADFDNHFNINAEDVVADDWEYRENVWVSK